jgi:gas vesicle protein
MNKMNEKVKVMLAFLVGTLAGSILGVLFAPAKGTATRKQLVSRTPDLEADLRKKMKDDADAIRTRAKQMERYTQVKVQNVKNSIKQKTGNLKHKMAVQEN